MRSLQKPGAHAANFSPPLPRPHLPSTAVWQNACTVAASLTISLIYGWQLAVIILALFPLTLFGAFVQFRVRNGLMEDRELYEGSSQVIVSL